MKRRVGDIWEHYGLMRMMVRVVDGSGGYAYWIDRSCHEVLAGTLDLEHPLLAGQFVGGGVNGPCKRHKRVISLQFTVTLKVDRTVEGITA